MQLTLVRTAFKCLIGVLISLSTAIASSSANATNPAGYVMLIHGLNLNPAKMLSLASDLEKMGLTVENVELAGHREGTDWTKVTREEWLSEIKAAYDIVREKADRDHVPLYFVGYSLGALLTIDLESQDSGVHFDRAVLFSPAIEVHSYSYLIEALNFAPSMTIPSASPKEYRYNSGTSVAAYKALFQALKSVHNSDLSNANVPTTVIIDPKDELVSLSKLEDLINRKALSKWQIMTVTNKESTLKKTYHHLIIDSAAVGDDQWKKIVEQIQTTLLERTPE